MDNNNNNVSGIPNVSDIKFDDTPAQSFDNLYGGTSQVQNNVSQGPSMASNSGMTPNMNQGPSMTPNLGMAPNMNQGQSMTPNPGMAPNMNQGPNMAPNSGMTPNMNQGPSMAPNPGTIIQDDLSNIEIDDAKMQSIEEQLSKTSQYNPSDFQQEQIVIPTDNQSGKNNSGLVFVIVLFIILAVVIALLPQITKLIT